MSQSVDEVYNSLAGVYDPQTTLLNQQMAQADTDATAQMSALDQAKVNAFKTIDNSANAKGMLFSGFSPDQQAQYVGTKYLPAVATLKSNTLNTKNTLASKISQLNAQRRQDAESTVAAQQKAEQDQAYKDAQLSLSYARLGVSQSRADASAAAAANKPLTQQQAVAAIRAGLEQVKGRDGHVSPYDLKKAYSAWTGSGYNPNDFWKYYRGYWNPNQKNYSQIFNSA